MSEWPKAIDTEAELEEVMTRPSAALCEMMQRLDGDIAILGIGGKMGITLGQEAVRACREAGVTKRIIGVSRFSRPDARQYLEAAGLETIACDLMDRAAVAALPKCQNIIYMAGRKFGTSDGGEALTWAMNTTVPDNVGRHFHESRIVAFSTGNIYPQTTPAAGGGCEDTVPDPIGDYAQSCLGRERIFDHLSRTLGTKVLLFRLNYAIDLRYGVLHDIGAKVLAGEQIDLATPSVNVIWQGDANTQALLALEHCTSPATALNITGPETVSIHWVATQFGRLLNKQPNIADRPGQRCLLNNAAVSHRLFGYPRVSLLQLIEWTAHWLQIGGASLGKPTHFEVRDGKF